VKYPNYLFEYIEDNKRLRAELAAVRSDIHNWEHWRDECERAKAEADDLKDELAELAGRNLSNSLDRSAAEAAIARVREVCANPPVPSRMLIPLIHAAIEGSE
jgi:CRISPR/Cas system-associated endonuclease Cas1